MMTSVCLKAAEVSERYAEHSVLAEGKWVKIRVKEAGIYQLTDSQLRSMGFSNPDHVCLYGLGLEVLPETNIEDISDDLVEIPLYRTGGKVLFYGRGQTKWTLNSATETEALFTHFNNPYSLYTYYFLTERTETAPKEFEKYVYETAADAPVINSFPDHALIEKDAYSFLNAGRVFFDSYDYATGNSQTYLLELPGLTDNCEPKLTVQFCTAGNTTSTLSIDLNGDELGTMTFGPLGDYQYGKLASRTFSLTDNVTASNRLKLTHTRSSNVAGRLDYIRTSYLRTLHMAGSSLLFRPNQGGDVLFELSGGDENTVVWRISSPETTEEVAGIWDAATGVLTLPFSSEESSNTSDIFWRNEELIALNPSAQFPSPFVIGSIENQDLHALQDIDLVVVVPASGHLTQQAQRLANAHSEKDGLRCIVLTADKIYNEFSSGTPDATAIRRLMKMLYDRGTSTSTQPQNLLLFGSCVWDNRMVTPSMSRRDQDDYLLCYESDNSLSHTDSYVLEEYFCLTDDRGTSNMLTLKPRIGVGRIPVTTVTEAKQVVDKLLTYINNEQVGAWKNNIVVMADDGNNNRHMQDGDAIIKQTNQLNPDFLTRRIYWDTYTPVNASTGTTYPEVTRAIYKQMEDGALIMNYQGHAAAYCLSHEQVVRTNDFASWSSPRLPLWITAACDVAPFDMNEENLAETALLNPKGAAMGLITTARTVYPDPNRALNLRFMKRVLNQRSDGHQYTLGQALTDAKCELIDIGSSSTNKAHFILLGDPAIKLALPTYHINIDKINGLDASSEDIEQVSAGSIVSVEGHIACEDGNRADTFNGSIHPIIQDNVEHVVCKHNAANASGETADAHEFDERLRTLYTCADSVHGGTFQFSFPIPLDNNYSGKTGLISLYASNTEHTVEAQGYYNRMVINGTSSTLSTDTIGPSITMALNGQICTDGMTVNETPLLTAWLDDADGINMTGSGVGHDIMAIIDNDETQTYSLNSYFTPTIGDYRSGSITFSLPELTDGPHTLTMRAYDILNNPSIVTTQIFVNVGARPTIETLRVSSPVWDEATFSIVNDRPGSQLTVRFDVYDTAGRHIWSTRRTETNSTNVYTYTWNLGESNTHLTPGIYIVKAHLSTSGGKAATATTKFIVVADK